MSFRVFFIYEISIVRITQLPAFVELIRFQDDSLAYFLANEGNEPNQ